MKDVGKIFENKLSDGKRKPSESVWEKIDTYLEAEKSRRTRILYTWLVGGGLVSIFLLFLLFNNELILLSNSSKDQNKVPMNDLLDISSEPSSEKELANDNDDKELYQISEEKVSSINKDPKENPSPLLKSDENRKQYVIQESVEENKESQPTTSRTKLNNKISKGGIEDKTFKVSKTYYYYNSATGTQLMTKNKKVIDSLISEQSINPDTLNTSKIDSIVD